jgi:type I restriction enzyme S subunit
VLPETLEHSALAKADCFTIRAADSIIPDYLAMQIGCHRSHEFLSSDVHGATRPRVNLTQVKALPIPLCSIEEQRQIITRYTTLVNFVSRIEGRTADAVGRVESTIQSALKKAFRGEFSDIGDATVL